MKSSYRERQRYARHARFIRRNKHLKMNRQQFEELLQARRAAAGLAVLNLDKITRIEVAPQIKVENLSPQLYVLLKAFGHPEAGITDESRVRNMLRDGKKLVRIRKRLKIRIATNDYIFAVAERLLARQERRK